jgi:hypothetical protein
MTGVAPAKVVHGEAIDLNRNVIKIDSSPNAPIVYMDSWVEV